MFLHNLDKSKNQRQGNTGEHTSSPFAKHTIDSIRTLVLTDQFTSYRDLKRTRNHKTVNHSRKVKFRFVTEDGVHTNNAESCHSAIKRMVLKQGRMSMLPKEADKIISLYTLLFKKRT